jgi:predicted nucleotide-binding protein (sugar kinase/HSP70/actin superfamily)
LKALLILLKKRKKKLVFMSKKRVISFPHMGDYYVPVSFLAKHILDGEILPAPSITKKTLELGSKYSPDFVCVPFKYNLGNYIEALEAGANILVQTGGGCRFGYYGEVQEQILHDLGYDFEFVNILDVSKTKPLKTYKLIKKINPKLSLIKGVYYFLITVRMVYYMDELDHLIRKNIGFQVKENTFENYHKKFLREISEVTRLHQLKRIYKKYKHIYENIEINKPDNPLRVGIIGELFTSMEPFSSFFLERELAKKGIEVSRYTTVTYLLFQKKKRLKKTMKEAKNYLKYTIGADGTDNVARANVMAMMGYDGIIHTKPFGCTPEVNAMPILQKISNDYKIPILYFSFDSQTSETGVQTRLEAFYDMLLMRRGE